MSAFSRRGFLKGVLSGAGAAVGTRIGGASWEGEAKAATEPTAVLLLHFIGGYNAIFASARQLVGSFGVTTGNSTPLGNGLSVDNTFADSMSAFVKGHMAAVGVRHQISNHPGAQRALWTIENQNAGLMLANAIGGNAALKAAVVGGTLNANMPKGAIAGTSFQSISDMQKTIDALGGGAPSARVPDRGIALNGVGASQKMSENVLAGSPASLDSLTNGYGAAVENLRQPVQKFDFAELKTAYTLGESTAVNSFKAKLAAAELMIRSGTNVVTLLDGGWDTHGDRDGTRVRTKMRSTTLPPLNTFLRRMVEDPSRNVVVVMFGDFSRSLPGSDHQPNLSATVIGKYVKQGSTGRVDAQVRLAADTPGPQGFWSYIAAAAKVPISPFGRNLHPDLLLP